MSKKNKKDRTDDGYYKLIPRNKDSQDIEPEVLASQPWIIKDAILGKKTEVFPCDIDNDAAREEALCEIIRKQWLVIEALQETLNASEEIVQGICDSVGVGRDEYDEDFAVMHSRTPFFRAFLNGIDLRQTNLSELIPDFLRNIDGVNLDYHPGRGLSITPHYKTTEA